MSVNHETRSLDGTVVAITGATSGIGRAAARQLVERGARVAITGRRADRLDELVAELGADSALAVPGDIANPSTSNRLVEAAIERWGRLDSLVASAGSGLYGGISENTDDELAAMMDANFAGTVWSVRAAIDPMVEAHGGDIVVISSVAGIRGGANEAVYAGTKAAQLVFAGAVDREVREKGVRVTTICPAAVKTEFAMGHGRTEGDAWLDDVMMPEDVAAAVVTTLEQPRRLRTTVWAMWSAAEAS
jgi:NADP-dependent 3-hydroxy acid dehydrogenase YdfG